MAVRAQPETIPNWQRPAPSRIAGLATSFGFIFSTAAHAALLALLLLRPFNDRGMAPDLSDAMSIELVASSTLEAIDSPAEMISPSAMPETAPPPAVEQIQEQRPEVEPVEVTQPPDANADVATETPPAESADAKTIDAAQDVAVIRGTAAPDDTAPPARTKPDKNDSRHRSEIRKAARQRDTSQKSESAPRRTEKSAASNAGAVASVASKSKAAASRGDVAGYAARVRARVAGRRPSGNGVRGSVVISFSVSGSGGLGSARIAKSSGSGSLDAAALQAVRGAAPFPPPPGGRSLSFSVPFHYR